MNLHNTVYTTVAMKVYISPALTSQSTCSANSYQERKSLTAINEEKPLVM